MKIYSLKTICTLLGACSLGMLSQAQDIQYLQGFHNNAPETQHIAEVYDWEAYFSSDATRAPGNRISYFVGAATVSNVNASTPHGDNIERGFWTVNDFNDQFAYTEVSIDRNDNLQMSMEMRHNSAEASWHFAVRVGVDAWYVSTQAYAAESLGWNRFLIEAGPQSTWHPLFFEAGQSMFIDEGTTVEMSSVSGEIAAVGFFGNVNTGTNQVFRFDNFTVGSDLVTFSYPYLQAFSNDTYNEETDSGSQFSPNHYEWESYFNSASTGNATRVPGNRITFLLGSEPLANVNAIAPQGDALDRGYWLMAVTTDQMGYTEVNLPRVENMHIGFDMRNDSADAVFRAMIRIGVSDWYVSELSYAAESEDWEQVLFEAGSESEWRELNFASGAPMAISSNPAVRLGDLVGDITAVGFYGSIDESSATRFRMDNFGVGPREFFDRSRYFSGRYTVSFSQTIHWNPIFGFFFDGDFPFVYSFTQDEWVWVHTVGDGPEEAFYFYSYTSGNWYWSGSTIYPQTIVLD